MHYLDIDTRIKITCIYSGRLISDNKITVKEMKMVYHTDELPIDIGYSLTGLLPIHCVC